MILPPTGKGVATAKPRVTGTELRLAIRSLEEIDIDTNVTCVKIEPDDTATLGEVSADVAKYTPTLPEVAAPIFNPDIVTVTAAPAEIETPDVVKTNEVVVLALHVKVRPDMLLSLVPTVGKVLAKKADGYVIVIALPALRGEDGENPIVILTLSFPAIRSDDAMTNKTFLTCPNIAPDDSDNDGTVSAELCRYTAP